MTQFHASFDDASMKQIAQFAGFATLLRPELQDAESKIADLIIQKTQDNGLARFAQNSPGGLAESFYATNTSAMEIDVGSDKPYAHRLDAGFGEGGVDAADSLGRVYHNPPTNFFTDAVNEVEDSGEGMEILQEATEKALGNMGVSF